MTLDAQLEDILVCPKSKSRLLVGEEYLLCTNPECRLRFDIRDEIPIMLGDEATELPFEQWRVEMQKYGQATGGEGGLEQERKP